MPAEPKIPAPPEHVTETAVYGLGKELGAYTMRRQIDGQSLADVYQNGFFRGDPRPHLLNGAEEYAGQMIEGHGWLFAGSPRVLWRKFGMGIFATAAPVVDAWLARQPPLVRAKFTPPTKTTKGSATWFTSRHSPREWQALAREVETNKPVSGFAGEWVRLGMDLNEARAYAKLGLSPAQAVAEKRRK